MQNCTNDKALDVSKAIAERFDIRLCRAVWILMEYLAHHNCTVTKAKEAILGRGTNKRGRETCQRIVSKK